jgi:hypothetical protein
MRASECSLVCFAFGVSLLRKLRGSFVSLIRRLCKARYRELFFVSYLLPTGIEIPVLFSGQALERVTCTCYIHMYIHTWLFISLFLYSFLFLFRDVLAKIDKCVASYMALHR